MNKTQLIESLRRKGFSEHITKAFEKVKREDFVPDQYREYAYEDTPIPIHKNGSTTSQPYTIAFMLNLLELNSNSKQEVLEIGSGSGYVLALIQEITKGETYGVEIVKDLVDKSKQNLKNYKNITVINKSGKNGLPKYTPYDRILVSAACPDLETAKNLNKQLKDNVDGNQDLAGRFQVMSIPTTIFFKNKEQVDTNTGAISFEDLKKKVEDNFK